MGIKKTYPYSATVILGQPLWEYTPQKYIDKAKEVLGDNEFVYITRQSKAIWNYNTVGNYKEKSDFHYVQRIRFYFKNIESRNLFILVANDLERGTKVVYNK